LKLLLRYATSHFQGKFMYPQTTTNNWLLLL